MTIPGPTSKLRRKSYETLLAGAKAANPLAVFDARGYAERWQQNLFAQAPLAEIEEDLSAGAGQELQSKFLAAHSSSALVVNCFSCARMQPNLMPWGETVKFKHVRFEVICPTGLHGTPPHLDMVAEGESILGVESKCTEWMTPKSAKFSDSYLTLNRLASTAWFRHMLTLRQEPLRYQFLDAAQLIKHAFGLLTTYAGRPTRLLYLFWEPANATSWQECRQHRAEIADFTSAVCGESLSFESLSYPELWREWGHDQPHWDYIQTRYVREA